jgi:hypothetical protein
MVAWLAGWSSNWTAAAAASATHSSSISASCSLLECFDRRTSDPKNRLWTKTINFRIERHVLLSEKKNFVFLPYHSRIMKGFFNFAPLAWRGEKVDVFAVCVFVTRQKAAATERA